MVAPTSFLGTINNFPLNIRVNNTELMRITPLGTYTFHALSGTGNGLMILDNTGTLSRLDFNGSINHVLLGNGTFGMLSNLTGWFVSPGVVYTNGKVGINGLSNPNEALEVNGNAIFNGNVSAQQFYAGDVVNSGKSLRISNTLCLKGFDPNVQGSRSEICAQGNDFYIQSTSGINKNTILNYSNSGNVGIGTNSPSEKLDVDGNIKVSGKISTNEFATNRISFIDSTLLIGDSTIVMATQNRMYPDYLNWTSSTTIKGIGIGHPGAYGFGEYALGLGKQARAYGKQSIAIGHFARTSTTAENAITIGSGYIPSSQPLENTNQNSLMIGFNSNLPTLFVSSASGPGTTGRVAIGTTYTPVAYKLSVDGKIICTEVNVSLRANWPDYVFSKNYKLMDLSDVEDYIKLNGHLPNVPDASTIEKNGVDLGETNRLLMEKIEELTLYLIEMKKEIELLKNEQNK